MHAVAESDGADSDCIGHLRPPARVKHIGEDLLIVGLRGLYIHDMIVQPIPSMVPNMQSNGC